MRLDVSTKRGYEIAAALRGPDFSGGFILKMVFTARIRALVGVSDKVAAATRHGCISSQEVRELRNTCQPPLLPGGASHYLGHIVTATNALKDAKLERLARVVDVGILDSLTDEVIIDLAGGEGTE